MAGSTRRQPREQQQKQEERKVRCGSVSDHDTTVTTVSTMSKSSSLSSFGPHRSRTRTVSIIDDQHNYHPTNHSRSSSASTKRELNERSSSAAAPDTLRKYGGKRGSSKSGENSRSSSSSNCSSSRNKKREGDDGNSGSGSETCRRQSDPAFASSTSSSHRQHRRDRRRREGRSSGSRTSSSRQQEHHENQSTTQTIGRCSTTEIGQRPESLLEPPLSRSLSLPTKTGTATAAAADLELPIVNTFDDAVSSLEQKQQQMQLAVTKGDYVLVGQLEREVQRLQALLDQRWEILNKARMSAQNLLHDSTSSFTSVSSDYHRAEAAATATTATTGESEQHCISPAIDEKERVGETTTRQQELLTSNTASSFVVVSTFSDAILLMEHKQKQMHNAIDEGDYILAGKFEKEVKQLGALLDQRWQILADIDAAATTTQGGNPQTLVEDPGNNDNLCSSMGDNSYRDNKRHDHDHDDDDHDGKVNERPITIQVQACSLATANGVYYVDLKNMDGTYSSYSKEGFLEEEDSSARQRTPVTFLVHRSVCRWFLSAVLKDGGRVYLYSAPIVTATEEHFPPSKGWAEMNGGAGSASLSIVTLATEAINKSSTKGLELPFSNSNDDEDEDSSIASAISLEEQELGPKEESEPCYAGGDAIEEQQVEEKIEVANAIGAVAALEDLTSRSTTDDNLQSDSKQRREVEPGFYQDAHGVEYYLDKTGIEYYKGTDGKFYADIAPGRRQEEKEDLAAATEAADDKKSNDDDAGWFIDLDGAEYYVDQNGIEYYKAEDGMYYNDQGQRLPLAAWNALLDDDRRRGCGVLPRQ